MARKKKYCFLTIALIFSIALFLQTNKLNSQIIRKPETICKKVDSLCFKKIEVRGNLDVILFDSDEQYMTIECQKSELDYIKYHLNQDSTLTIYYDKNTANSRPKISIHFTCLNEIFARDHAHITCYTNFSTTILSAQSDFYSSIQLFISSSVLYCNIKGDGKLYIAGEIDTLFVKTQNESETTFDLRSRHIYSEVNDYSSLLLNGSADFVQTIVNKEGYFQALSLKSHHAILEVFDNGEAQIHADEKVDVSAMGHGSVIIKGTPKEFTEHKSRYALVRK